MKRYALMRGWHPRIIFEETVACRECLLGRCTEQTYSRVNDASWLGAAIESEWIQKDQDDRRRGISPRTPVW